MKLRTIAIGMIFLIVTFTLTWAAENVGGSATNQPKESILYTEGIGLDGLEVTENMDDYPYTLVGPANNVMIDWSDDIIFHQFPVGQKVRTEVILHNINTDKQPLPDPNPAVYSITSHLMIQKITGKKGNPVGEELYNSSIAEGLFTIGPTDAYSAEINQEGNLLYGYNWDTRGLQAGWYRLTFWLEKDETCPDEHPITQDPIIYNNTDLTSHAPGDNDTSSGDIYGFVYDDFSNNSSWIDLELLARSSGRK